VQSTTIEVDKFAPTLTVGSRNGTAGNPIDEGRQDFTANIQIQDPGRIDTFTGTVDFGDGSGQQNLTINSNRTFSLTHNYGDNGAYTVSINVTDKDGGSTSLSLTVTVVNVPPTITSVPTNSRD